MFINKTPEGLNNICGKNIKIRRKEMGIEIKTIALILKLTYEEILKEEINSEK